ncbi:hypothetical protein RFI_19859 [Reticulomyxa filosa]|uniref:Uncharacterized protein n=1 Tax=Reticulomyxa filosa TaxID=46433 RepID=X6MU19_RETFI|nr:hypothetical protein RFI_19859 [Reticulomyxa filosa]|eukprot:ETO17463.1 hypothetical protein RFI_19859 [Reticulomyxa filosa]
MPRQSAITDRDAILSSAEEHSCESTDEKRVTSSHNNSFKISSKVRIADNFWAKHHCGKIGRIISKIGPTEFEVEVVSEDKSLISLRVNRRYLKLLATQHNTKIFSTSNNCVNNDCFNVKGGVKKKRNSKRRMCMDIALEGKSCTNSKSAHRLNDSFLFEGTNNKRRRLNTYKTHNVGD